MQIPKFLNFLNKNEGVHESQQKLPFAESLGIMPQSPEEDGDAETVTSATKIKVVAAFLIVGIAAYIAFWVQEPAEYKAQLISGSEEVAADMVAAAPQTEAAAVPTEELASAPATEADTSALAVTEPPATVETVADTQQDLSTQEVSIIDFNFDPPELTVPVGGTLVWTNKDSVPHTVSGLDFTSGTLNPGESFTYLFTDEGTFDYACALHPQMKGKIIVGSGVSAMLNMQTEEIVPVEAVVTQVVEPVVTEPVFSPENLGFGGNELTTPLVTSADIQNAHASAEESAASLAESKKLAKSGPEDLVYVLAFGIILFLNRKKILLRSR